MEKQCANDSVYSPPVTILLGEPALGMEGGVSVFEF